MCRLGMGCHIRCIGPRMRERIQSLGLTMLPFTRAEFFEVFAAYNAGTWPAAIAVYPLAFFALFLAWRGAPPDPGQWPASYSL